MYEEYKNGGFVGDSLKIYSPCIDENILIEQIAKLNVMHYTGGYIPKQLFNDSAKSFTIHYKDKTSYTTKVIGTLTIHSKPSKRNKVVVVGYGRKPRSERIMRAYEGYSLTETSDVQMELTLNEPDVLSIEIKQDDRTIELTKF